MKIHDFATIVPFLNNFFLSSTCFSKINLINSIHASTYPDVILIRSNTIINDPRTIKLTNSLSKKYRVLALGWDREKKQDPVIKKNNNLVIKCFQRTAPYGNIRLIFYYPLFWLWIFFNLMLNGPRIIHACDFETVVPSFMYRLINPRVKIIFDSFDRYAMAFIPEKNKIIYKLIFQLENIFASKSDALITVSEERLQTFGKYLPKKHLVVMNCPEDSIIARKNKKIYDTFTIVYSGSIADDRGISIIINVLKNMDAKLFLAGRILSSRIKVLNNKKITYVGLLDHYNSLLLQQTADVIPVLYDPSIPINRVANPNKLFEAMMLGVPVISNVCKSIIDETKCGLFVNYDIESVSAALQCLQSSASLRTKLGSMGRYYFEKKYNWAIMENRLLKLYAMI